MGDPFGTAALRAAVLDAWASSPTRFREDANAEEDLRLGGYADAWFVELAQNAADAARAGGVPGRLVVTITDGELRVANTGAPLTADGVAALASLRASAKRDSDSVGRFGVGFAAVLAVTDAPRVISRDGGVAFSAARTAAAVAGLPGPAAELARRDEPPVLRLVWAVDEPPSLDTEVRMPLRPGVEASALLARARADAPDLLLALPDLHEITVDGETVRRTGSAGITVVDGRRWRLVRRTGHLDVADRAVEQRGRRDWTVCWALPLDGSLPAGEVLHAPTATGERLALPARLIATVPLEPDRRRARPGPVTDRVLAAAADAYVNLVRAVDPAGRTALVPEPGFPRSALDGRLRELVVDALRAAPWLGVADLVPAAAQWLDLPGADDGELPALLAVAGFDTLVTTPVPASLGVERMGPAGLVERLYAVEQPPAWWRSLYAALAPLVDTVPHLRDDLRALPVPLADGRRAAGPPTVLLPAGVTWRLPLPGLHLAHPDAVHPLLERLGATVAGPRALLEHPVLRVAVDDSVDDADPRPLAEAVLALVGELGAAPDGYGALALPDVDGVPTRADELMLPDAALRPLLAFDSPLGIVDAPWAERSSLVAVGVTDGFALVRDEEPAAPEHDLDDEDRWWDSLAEPPRRMAAVRDLDLIADDAWPAALDLLAAGRETHAALTEPGSYTAWWLARHARLAGHRPDHWRLPSATTLTALYDPVPEPATRGRETGDSREPPRVAGFPPPSCGSVDGIDPREGVWAAIGVRADLTVADADAAADLLERLADPGRRPDVALVAEAHAALTGAVVDGRVHPDDLDAPERVRALDGAVVSVDVAVVLEVPWPAAVLPAGELVAGGDPAVLADLLDLPLATEVVAGDVDGDGRPVAWADLAEVVVACHALGIAVPPGAVTVHDELWVAVTRPVTGRFRVPAWPGGRGGWHAEDPLRGLLALVAP